MTEQIEITRDKAVGLIRNSNGQFFTAEFNKRGKDEYRVMNCRLNVKKYLKGGQPAYSFTEKRLIPVFDMQNGYRCIPEEGIKVLKINGHVYQVVED